MHTVRVTLEAVCLSVAVREGRLTNDPFATDCNFSVAGPMSKRRHIDIVPTSVTDDVAWQMSY